MNPKRLIVDRKALPPPHPTSRRSSSLLILAAAARRQGTSPVTARLDGRPSGGRFSERRSGRGRDLSANFTATMEKLTFPQRVERMLAATQDVRSALDLLAQAVPIIEEEAAAMKAAELRFAAKKSKDDAKKD